MSAALAATGSPFPIPTIEYSAILPILIVLGAAVVSVLFEALLPQRARRNAQLVLVFVALVASFAAVIASRGAHEVVAMGSVAVDGPASPPW